MPSLSDSMSLFPNNLNGLQAGLADNAKSLSKHQSPTSVISNINPVIMKCSIFLLNKPTKKVCYVYQQIQRSIHNFDNEIDVNRYCVCFGRHADNTETWREWLECYC